MKRILAVDDVKDNLKMVENILKTQYLVSLAKSGTEALELLKRVRIDLVLLDIVMPDMDGYEVMKKIAQDPDIMGIPVIFLTGDADKDTEVKCLEMGAVDFIRKPITPEVLIGRIKKAMEFEDVKTNLERDASCDPMTNLWNRRYIRDYIEAAGAVGSRGAFLMLDIDDFKSINDSYGHDTGDKALICFAETLSGYTGKNMCAGRLGGDEFVLFFKGDYSTEDISEECRKLIASIEIRLSRLTEACGDVNVSTDLGISVSIGIAMMPTDGNSFDVLYQNADKALYYIKQNGKRGYHFYQKSLNGIDNEQQRNQIDIVHLRMMIEEKGQECGAYKVGYDGFQKIYRFVARCVERNDQPVQIVLFTITGNKNGEDISEAMNSLSSAASKSLRRGDVIARFSGCQYVVILMGASTDNGKIAAERAVKRWKKIQSPDSGLSISYEIQSIEKDDEKTKKTNNI